MDNATEALDVLKGVPSDHFHLILLDMLLPDRNGYDILPQMRKLIGPNVAVVMASANSHVRGARGKWPAPPPARAPQTATHTATPRARADGRSLWSSCACAAVPTPSS